MERQREGESRAVETSHDNVEGGRNGERKRDQERKSQKSKARERGWRGKQPLL